MESELLEPVPRFLHAQRYRSQAPEVPFYEHRVDLYGHDPDSGRTIAVELKLSRWRRAIEQALLYQLCADLTVIALPERAARKVDRAMIDEHGIGLWAVDPQGCEELAQPRRGSVVRPHYREALIEWIRDYHRSATSRTEPS